MLSIHRIAATATVAAALCVPATAAADDWYKDGSVGTAAAKYTLADGRTPDQIAPAEPKVQTGAADRRTPDRVGGIPSDNPVVPATRIVEVPADTGFEWGDAAIGGAATLALILLLAGGGMTLRPGRVHRAAAPSR